MSFKQAFGELQPEQVSKQPNSLAAAAANDDDDISKYSMLFSFLQGVNQNHSIATNGPASEPSITEVSN